MSLYRNGDGTEIDVADEMIAAMGPGWSKYSAGTPASSGAGSTAPESSSEPTADDGPPPKGGKGSSDAAWTAYAHAHGVNVTDEMSRKEVIAACEKAGVRVD